MNIADINKAQEILRKDLQKSLNEHKYSKSVKLIETFSEVTRRVNNIKKDDVIEDSLRQLSLLCKSENILIEYQKRTVVFYDQIGTTVCLGVQYLRGLISAGYKVVYVYESYRAPISPELFNVITSLGIEYKLFYPSTPFFSNSCYIGKQIVDFIISIKPEIIVMHPSASDAIGMSVMYALKDIKKYYIVPGDHHFYAGMHSADYLIEFRDFGISVSVNERKINPSKIYKLPYYPIIDELSEFIGYPIDVSDKVVFVTAGATYKFLGSNLIYDIWKRILKYENTVIFYMGEPGDSIKKFVKKEEFNHRFYFLGYRKDFIQCIKNADVFVNSYPYPGALVSQTAARFSKPIVSYSEEKDFLGKNIEEMLGGYGRILTKTSLDALYNYIDKLSTDRLYRESEGKKAKELLQTKEKFDRGLQRILNNECKTVDYVEELEVDPVLASAPYISQQNKWQPNIFVPLILQYGFLFLTKFAFFYKDILKNPFYIMKFLALYIRRIFV